MQKLEIGAVGFLTIYPARRVAHVGCYVVGMKITRRQSAALAEMVGTRQAWLGRVVKRLEKLGYLPDDPLLAAAMNANDALARLRMSAHYSAVDGAGRKAE